MSLDFTQQIKRGDDFISQQLKDLSKKSCFVVSNDGLCSVQENWRGSVRGARKSGKVVKRGTVLRQGDIIKFGRVPVLIKEWSLDCQRWQYQEDVKRQLEYSSPGQKDHQDQPLNFILNTPANNSMFQDAESAGTFSNEIPHDNAGLVPGQRQSALANEVGGSMST